VARIDYGCPAIVLSRIYRANTKLLSRAAVGAKCSMGSRMAMLLSRSSAPVLKQCLHFATAEFFLLTGRWSVPNSMPLS
jgi:hypothetical protein